MKQDATFSLRDTLNVFYRKIIWLKLTVLILPLGVLLACLFISPVYESTAKILVTAKKESSSLLQLPKDAASSTVLNLNVDETDLNSEMELLQSIDLWVRTVKKLGMPALKKQENGFISSVVFRVEDSLGALVGDSQDKKAQSKKESAEIHEEARKLAKKLKVVPAPKSRVIDLSFKYSNPEMAYSILSALLEEYVPYHLEVYAVPGAEGFFSGQGELFKEKLDTAENQLTQFKRKWGISSIDKQKTELITLLKQMADSFVELDANLSQYENMLSALKQDRMPTGQLTPTMQRGNENTVLSVIATQLLRAKQKQLIATQHFSPESRDYRDAEATVKEITEKFREALQTEIALLKAKRASLEESRKEKELQLQQLDEKGEELRRLQLAAAIAKERYVQYLTKEEEARVENLKGGKKLVNVSVVETPFVPKDPVFPKTLLMVVGSFFLAIPLGIGFVLLANFFDHTFDTPTDVENQTGLPVLASIRRLQLPDEPKVSQ
ncbi:GumC family protein [Desulfomonile tiedjei]|uniref:Uncharacterized protein involved in exopolysaccharide biosynthesis n=1 Tax=Desulfomonile tiedjei (strain ATCC 49306 / DSM 6799 / DCB-1) TaxID=706587 RepID=I4C275_DESTA|nr:GumC family protein [Desulfomonile tiedjei]AFM23666.1 uncharacterized protein involved in exopolysaccharide biosynthesis [Desulfomonile tiedjei DSM 6799]